MLKDLLREVVSTEDITVSRPGRVPALMEITVLGRTQTSGQKRHLCCTMTDTLVTQAQGALVQVGGQAGIHRGSDLEG